MTKMFSDLESSSKELTADPEVDSSIVRNCNDLMKLMKTYKSAVDGLQSSTDRAQSVKEIQRQASAIASKIQDFSKEATGNVNWLKILGIALVTAGLGLLVMVPMLAFSKTALRNEHPIVEQARGMMQQGDKLIRENTQSSLHKKM